jgi:myosin heavy subunit
VVLFSLQNRSTALIASHRLNIVGACIHGRVSIACLLLERGADPTIKDKNGKTAFDVAVSSCSSLSFISKNTNALNSQIDTLTKEKETLADQVDTLSSEKAELLQEKETLVQEMETWKTRHEEMEQTAYTLHEQNNMMQATIETLTNEKATVLEQVQTLSQATTELLQESETLTQETETWETRHDEMKQKSDSFKKQNDGLTKQMDTLASEKKTLEQQIHMLSGEQVELSKENEALTQENYTLMNRHAVMEQKGESLKEQIKMWKVQNASLMEQTAQLKTSLANIEKWQQKEEQLKAQIDNLQETVNRHEQKEHERLQVEHANVLQKLAHFEPKMQPQEQGNRVRRQALIRRDAETSPRVESAEIKEPPVEDNADDQDLRSSADLIHWHAATAEEKQEPEMQDQAASNAKGSNDQRLISVDSSLSDGLVSIMVTDMTKSTPVAHHHHHRVDAVGGHRVEQDIWMQIADVDANHHHQQQQPSSIVPIMGGGTHCDNHANVSLQDQQSKPDEPVVVLSEIANLAPTTGGGETNMAVTKDDSKQKML